MMHYVPEVLFRLIQTFLTQDDYRYFLNSSKNLFASLKRKSIYFTLNKKQSLQYLEDKEFQSILLSKVENGWNQIGISFDSSTSSLLIPLGIPIHKIRGRLRPSGASFWNNFKSVQDYSPMNLRVFSSLSNVQELRITHSCESMSGIDLSPLSHLSVLSVNNLTDCDLTPLKDIPDLTLVYCEGINDFSMLSRHNSLVFHTCNELSDVKSFKFIRKLSLTHCPNVYDVSPLKGIYDLSLSDCLGIEDISGLGNHHRLFLRSLAHDLTEYESLLNVPHVTITDCNLEDLSVLQSAKSVVLNQCERVVDVRPLKNVKKVEIFSHLKLTGIGELSEVSDLSLILTEKQPEINHQFIDCLKNKRLKLLIADFDIINIPQISMDIKHLTIGFSETFTCMINEGLIAFIKHLTSLTLDSLAVVTLQGLGDIPNVRLVQCYALRSLEGLGRNRSVEVELCPWLEDVSSLATVQIVTIKSCGKLKDENCICLKNVPRLKIIQ